MLCCQHDTIDKVLQRGEKLDDLVEKSEELGLQSKTFYKTVTIAFLHLHFRTSLMLAKIVHIAAARLKIFFRSDLYEVQNLILSNRSRCERVVRQCGYMCVCPQCGYNMF